MKKWMLALLAICLIIPITVLAGDYSKQPVVDIRVQQLGVGDQNDYTKGRGLQEKEDDDQDGVYDSGAGGLGGSGYSSSGSSGGAGKSYRTSSGSAANSDAGTFLLFLSFGLIIVSIAGFLYKRRMKGHTPGYPRVKFIRPSVSPAIEIQKSSPGSPTARQTTIQIG